MIIKKQWRILTVGDGDLSFTQALNKHYQPKHLTGSVFDSLAIMTDKYRENSYQTLKQASVPLLFNFDVTDQTSWSTLNKNSFDLIIFQFPLLPAFNSFEEYQQRNKQANINILNRSLLRTFLKNAFQHFLDPQGEQLCYITSKDVKPYREWNIESALHQQADFYYLGYSLFNIEHFPGYLVRNVNRDKHVKDTQGKTYVWSSKEDHDLKSSLAPPVVEDENSCMICRAGPFSTEQDKNRHNRSKKHMNMLQFEASWLAHLALE